MFGNIDMISRKNSYRTTESLQQYYQWFTKVYLVWKTYIPDLGSAF